MGEWPYRGVYSAVALITFGWMIWAYVHTAREPLWPGLHLLPVIVVPIAFIFHRLRLLPQSDHGGVRNALLKSEQPARGMIRITRHPIMWGLMLWAAAHVLARGELKALVFFGSFLFSRRSARWRWTAGSARTRTGRASRLRLRIFPSLPSPRAATASCGARSAGSGRSSAWSRSWCSSPRIPWLFGARPY